ILLFHAVTFRGDYHTIVCDKGYDSEPFPTFVKERGGETVIAKRNYGQDIDKDSMDWCLYKYRHLVENAFGRIKHYRAISSIYDKLERNYASMLSLTFMLMWLPMYC
ncbi:transposase, partial [Vibrio breoganii]|uniref:transposase n=1 Tax=Vibrio breoganii TaxID=553239 RepID=UPI00036DFD1C